jgi:F-type H+-transporting ATPase subunit b
MVKKLLYIVLLMLPAVLMASGGEHETSRYFAQTGRHSDFIPRIFNFLVFAGLIYYLVASPIKDFFRGRREGIAEQLNEIESKLQEAKEAQKNAEQALVESEAKAKEIIADSKKEAALLAERLAESRAKDLELLEKLYEEHIEHDERRMVKETINAVLNENITSDDIPLSEKQVVEIIAKKVA